MNFIIISNKKSAVWGCEKWEKEEEEYCYNSINRRFNPKYYSHLSSYYSLLSSSKKSSNNDNKEKEKEKQKKKSLLLMVLLEKQNHKKMHWIGIQLFQKI